MKRIVMVGAGFAGLAAAKALRHSDAEVSGNIDSMYRIKNQWQIIESK